ncbi:MAG: co-chaperone GroES [Planctomycetes bacterium]|jgi:chaperonin GroES|nr:co-chaperone GroES [Planctomycetota bacterium]MBT4028639.1 co-chaperone GroES [Planctomycetota bacterium]MBT4559531.1 co-chaperone GroES [Planctomycetota bacterium]MBT7011599.1 co-chaperone GroES [Planctomycetota bacterium]MBT7318942.1 co-chaperone GroES [Planctomycetota bacterium]
MSKSPTFTPIEDRVLVRPVAAETVSPSGIVLPDSAQEKPNQGVVVAVGAGRTNPDGTRADMPIADGDTVVYGKYSGQEITLNGEDFKILRAADLLAKIDA